MMRKKYILHMLELLKTSKDLSSQEVFVGASELANDPEILEKVKETLRHLVSTNKFQAAKAEEIILENYPQLLGNRKSKPIFKSKPLSNKKTPIGPFLVDKFEHPIIIDFSRMGLDWIRKISSASPEERETIMKEFH